MPVPVVVQFEREIIDEVTDEVTDWVLITVEGEYCEGDASVGEGEHVYSELSYLHDDKSKTPIEITDWEEDQLLLIYKDECERVQDDIKENQWRSRREK